MVIESGGDQPVAKGRVKHSQILNGLSCTGLDRLGLTWSGTVHTKPNTRKDWAMSAQPSGVFQPYSFKITVRMTNLLLERSKPFQLLRAFWSLNDQNSLKILKIGRKA